MEPTAPPCRPAGVAGATDGARPPQGRGKWLIAGAVGLVGLVAAVCFRGTSVRRPATLTFVGFTNGVMPFGGTNFPINEAWFWVTNSSQRGRWNSCFVTAPAHGVLLDWDQTGRWVGPRVRGTNALPFW